MDKRVPLTDGVKPFTMFDADGEIQVQFLEVLGRGGSCIAYHGRKIVNGHSREVVIKEYYPESNNASARIQYYRAHPYTKLQIIAREKENEEALIEEELKRQAHNVERELKMADKLGYDGLHNSPFSFEASLLNRYGDSHYILLDTNAGQTLRKCLNDAPEHRLPWGQALRYMKMLLSIIDQTLDGRYVHADLKPDNIWITGGPGQDAGYMVLLDMGSVYMVGEYGSDAELSDAEAKQLAERICENDGLGSHSRGYCSSMIYELYTAKSAYLEVRSVYNARELIRAVNRTDVRADIYSAVQLLFELVTGEIYRGDGTNWHRRLSRLFHEEENVSDAAIDFLVGMMEKNDRLFYDIAAVRHDMEVLEALFKRDAHPLVLMEHVLKNLDDLPEYEIEETLLCDAEPV